MWNRRATGRRVLYCQASNGMARWPGRIRNRPLSRARNDAVSGPADDAHEAQVPLRRLRERTDVGLGHDRFVGVGAAQPGRFGIVGEQAREGAPEGLAQQVDHAPSVPDPGPAGEGRSAPGAGPIAPRPQAVTRPRMEQSSKDEETRRRTWNVT